MRPPRTRPLVVLGTALAAVTLTVAPAQAITGGTPTGDYGSPYVPTVRITLGLGDQSCTGTMISPETVVTAASCLHPVAPPAAARANAARPQHVPIGSVQPFNYTPVDGYVFGINGYVTRDDRDLALLHLDRPFENYRARLATTPPVTGQGVQINGYGRTTTDWVSAKQQVANATVGAVGATTFSVGGGSTTCKGDAGGPVYRGDPWDPEIVAVHTGSFQHGCLGETGTQDGTQETRLDDITDWIHQQDPDLDINCAGQPDAYATYPATKTMQAGLFGDAQFGSTWYGWGGGQTVNGWQGVTLAGPNKLAWNIHQKTGISDPFADGDLLLWHNVYQAPAPVKVGNGWGSFLQQANQNLVTVDSRGRIYAVNAQGELRMYNWDDATKRWTTPSPANSSTPAGTATTSSSPPETASSTPAPPPETSTASNTTSPPTPGPNATRTAEPAGTRYRI